MTGGRGGWEEKREVHDGVGRWSLVGEQRRREGEGATEGAERRARNRLWDGAGGSGRSPTMPRGSGRPMPVSRLRGRNKNKNRKYKQRKKNIDPPAVGVPRPSGPQPPPSPLEVMSWLAHPCAATPCRPPPAAAGRGGRVWRPSRDNAIAVAATDGLGPPPRAPHPSSSPLRVFATQPHGSRGATNSPSPSHPSPPRLSAPPPPPPHPPIHSLLSKTTRRSTRARPSPAPQQYGWRQSWKTRPGSRAGSSRRTGGCSPKSSSTARTRVRRRCSGGSAPSAAAARRAAAGRP